MARVIAAVSIVPIGTGETSVSRYVAAAQAVLARHPEIKHRLDPMFTNLEGELGQIFAVIQEMEEAVVAAGARRLSVVIKIDDRRDGGHDMEGKIRAVEAHFRHAECH
ncbi:MAG TPA: MTH1187 family thiamine-binding protein [Firmicutes bacterium]|nr:MTH1187 family thiamine-binding protein [Bacillota bacterium]